MIGRKKRIIRSQLEKPNANRVERGNIEEKRKSYIVETAPVDSEPIYDEVTSRSSFELLRFKNRLVELVNSRDTAIIGVFGIESDDVVNQVIGEQLNSSPKMVYLGKYEYHIGSDVYEIIAASILKFVERIVRSYQYRNEEYTIQKIYAELEEIVESGRDSYEYSSGLENLELINARYTRNETVRDVFNTLQRMGYGIDKFVLNLEVEGNIDYRLLKELKSIISSNFIIILNTLAPKDIVMYGVSSSCGQTDTGAYFAFFPHTNAFEFNS